MTLRNQPHACLIATVLGLGACSGGSEQAAEPVAEADPAQAPVVAREPTPSSRPDPATSTAAAPAPSGATSGGDGSQITLSALSASEIEKAELTGELGCSFSSANASPLLVAKGNVASKDPAFGLVKIGGYAERVAAPGGFDAMAKGATFSGRGTTIRITLTGPATGGGESPPRPATLTFDRADGAQRSFIGRWECGP